MLPCVPFGIRLRIRLTHTAQVSFSLDDPFVYVGYLMASFMYLKSSIYLVINCKLPFCDLLYFPGSHVSILASNNKEVVTICFDKAHVSRIMLLYLL